MRGVEDRDVFGVDCLGFVLMRGGIGLFGALTASLSPILVCRGNTDRAAIESLGEEVPRLRARLD